jgi:hypothetical protein
MTEEGRVEAQTPYQPSEGVFSTVVGGLEKEVVKEVDDIKEEIAEAQKLGFRGLVVAYFKKFAGRKEKRPPRYVAKEVKLT